MEIFVKVNIKGKKIEAKQCNKLEMLKGLMFSRRKKANALIFKFKKPTKMSIHSWFVFFPFLVIWLDERDRIIEIRKVEPFSISLAPKKPYLKLIEIPINDKYDRIILQLVKSFVVGRLETFKYNNE